MSTIRTMAWAGHLGRERGRGRLWDTRDWPLPGGQQGLGSTVIFMMGIGRDDLNSHCGWLGSHTASGKFLTSLSPSFLFLFFFF